MLQGSNHLKRSTSEALHKFCGSIFQMRKFNNQRKFAHICDELTIFTHISRRGWVRHVRNWGKHCHSLWQSCECDTVKSSLTVDGKTLTWRRCVAARGMFWFPPRLCHKSVKLSPTDLLSVAQACAFPGRAGLSSGQSSLYALAHWALSFDTTHREIKTCQNLAK